MTNLLILVVMMVTLMGAAAYGLAGAMRSLQTSIQTLIIEDRLEEATQGILANIIAVNTSSAQVYYVPAPDNLSTPAVPSWITPNAQTLRGVKFLYCPFSNASGTGGSTITTPSSSYTVNIGTSYAGTNVSSNNYVTQSSTRPSNASTALAILVAPGPNQSSVLSTQDCLSVTSTGTLPGATVRIITEQEVQSRAQVLASSGNEFYAASAASNDGKAGSASNYATFSTVMDYVTKYRPQRVAVDFKTSTTNNMTVNSANMDESSVATRQFSTVRNHSIYFNAGLGGAGATNFVTGASGTLSPIILGNSYFNSIGFTAVNGKLYRPVAQMFGNILFNGNSSFGFAQAENLGKIIILATAHNTYLAGATATSATGNEMFYMERGGMLRVPYTTPYSVQGPGSGYINNTFLYNEFGGGTSIDGTLQLISSNNSATSSLFYVGGDAWFSNSYNTTGASNSSYPHAEATEFYEDIAGRIYEAGRSTGFYNPEVYNAGGIYVISGVNGSGILSSTVNSRLTYLWMAGPGSTFGISSSPLLDYYSGSTYRPATSALNSDATATNGIMANFIGGNIVNHNDGTTPTLYGSNSGTTQCLADTAAYNIATGAGNTSGSTMAPAGNIGQEAVIILNRTSTTCN